MVCVAIGTPQRAGGGGYVLFRDVGWRWGAVEDLSYLVSLQ